MSEDLLAEFQTLKKRYAQQGQRLREEGQLLEQMAEDCLAQVAAMEEQRACTWEMIGDSRPTAAELAQDHILAATLEQLRQEGTDYQTQAQEKNRELERCNTWVVELHVTMCRLRALSPEEAEQVARPLLHYLQEQEQLTKDYQSS